MHRGIGTWRQLEDGVGGGTCVGTLSRKPKAVSVQKLWGTWWLCFLRHKSGVCKWQPMGPVWLVHQLFLEVRLCWNIHCTTKKAEHQRIDAFELWFWRRLLRVPWTARRSNQSILKEISPEYSLERLMLKLKLHYLGHLMWRTDSLEKTLMLGKIEGRKRSGRHRMK